MATAKTTAKRGAAASGKHCEKRRLPLVILGAPVDTINRVKSVLSFLGVVDGRDHGVGLSDDQCFGRSLILDACEVALDYALGDIEEPGSPAKGGADHG